MNAVFAEEMEFVLSGTAFGSIIFSVHDVYNDGINIRYSVILTPVDENVSLIDAMEYTTEERHAKLLAEAYKYGDMVIGTFCFSSPILLDDSDTPYPVELLSSETREGRSLIYTFVYVADELITNTNLEATLSIGIRENIDEDYYIQDEQVKLIGVDANDPM
jgi:hypothetical protein